jgi:hypothetical protein
MEGVAMRLSRIWLVLVVMLGIALAAQTNNSISFQGYLTDNNSMPYMGAVRMGFKFYDGNTDTSSELFQATDGKVRDVTVFNGNYTTKIEFSDPEINTLNAAADVWIEVYVASNTNVEWSTLSNNNNKLTPRIQLNAVPYALAVRGVYYDSANDIVKLGRGYQPIAKNINISVSNNSINVDSPKTRDPRNGGLVVQGRVGIGTPSPNYKFHVAGNAHVTGNVKSVSGMVSANKVYGAVWN